MYRKVRVAIHWRWLNFPALPENAPRAVALAPVTGTINVSAAANSGPTCWAGLHGGTQIDIEPRSRVTPGLAMTILPWPMVFYIGTIVRGCTCAITRCHEWPCLATSRFLQQCYTARRSTTRVAPPYSHLCRCKQGTFERTALTGACTMDPL